MSAGLSGVSHLVLKTTSLLSEQGLEASSRDGVPWERLLQVDVVTVPLQRAAGVPQERGRWLSLQEDTLS